MTTVAEPTTPMAASDGPLPAPLVEVLERRALTVAFPEILDPAVTPISDNGTLRSRCPHCHTNEALYVARPLAAGHPASYDCAVCASSGNIIDFCAAERGLPYTKALQLLAQRTLDAKQKETLQRRVAEAQMAADAARVVFRTAFEASAEAQELWTSRGFAADAAAVAHVGYAPADWAAFRSAMHTAGIGTQAMLDAGLLKRSKKRADRLVPTFRDRLMFPITDAEDMHVISFGGRRIVDDPTSERYSPQKYTNTENTALFRKSATLYGLGSAQRAIETQAEAIVVEGYFAWLRLRMLGYRNVVAPCGTGFSDAQAQMLCVPFKRKSPDVPLTVTVLFDDNARKKAVRAGEILAAAGARVRLPQMPEGSDDPDTWVRTSGPDGLRALLQDAPDLLDSLYAEHVAAYGAPLPLLARVTAFDQLFSLVRTMRSGVAQKAGVKRLASWFSVPVQSIVAEIKHLKTRDTARRR